jgi:hypothetical protein
MYLTYMRAPKCCARAVAASFPEGSIIPYRSCCTLYTRMYVCACMHTSERMSIMPKDYAAHCILVCIDAYNTWCAWTHMTKQSVCTMPSRIATWGADKRFDHSLSKVNLLENLLFPRLKLRYDTLNKHATAVLDAPFDPIWDIYVYEYL